MILQVVKLSIETQSSAKLCIIVVGRRAGRMKPQDGFALRDFILWGIKNVSKTKGAWAFFNQTHVAPRNVPHCGACECTSGLPVCCSLLLQQGVHDCRYHAGLPDRCALCRTLPLLRSSQAGRRPRTQLPRRIQAFISRCGHQGGQGAIEGH